MKHVFFISLLINTEVTAFTEGLKLVSKPMREIEKCAMLVVAKISTCDQRYKFRLQMAFELQW